MCTEPRRKLIQRTVLAAVLAAGLQAPAAAQKVEDPATWQEHQAIDAHMGMLQGPVWHPVWFSREDDPSHLSTSPFYKQQPPGAQGDFRPPPPQPVAPPTPPQPVADTRTVPAAEPEPVPEPEPEPDQDQPQDPQDPPNQGCELLVKLC